MKTRGRLLSAGRPPGGGQAKRGDAGFSLVEGLIAAALLLVIAVSILPLFTRALKSNLSGGRASQLGDVGQTGLTGKIETAGAGDFAAEGFLRPGP